MLSFDDLIQKVLEWAKDKDLLRSENADKQFLKFMEEVFEFKTVFDFKKWRNKRGVVFLNRDLCLEMGDVFVTLIILCKQLDISPVTCLDLAYDKIKDRKGKTINGVFVKEEDL